MQITVYTLPSCMKCKLLMRKFDAEGIEYIKVDNEEETMTAGYEACLSSLPIIKIDDEYYTELAARSLLGI